MIKRLSRFAIIGVLNTGLDILILNGLFFLWPPYGQTQMMAWENMLAFSAGAIQSFILNKFWTFKDTSPITFQQMLKFAGVTGRGEYDPEHTYSGGSHKDIGCLTR